MKRKVLAIGLLLALLGIPALAGAQTVGEAAASYASYALVSSVQEADYIGLVMERPDGRQTVICGVKAQKTGEYILQESAPIPEGMQAAFEYAMENDTLTLILQDKNGKRLAACSLAPYGQTWGIVMGDHNVGHFWVTRSRMPNGEWCFDSHPWSNISTIDWTNLPDSETDVLRAMDTQGWATPKSPNWHDRVHLRAAPRKSAVSLGKYYNGTPVKVLDYDDEWTHVSIFGVEGYMQTEYLAFGDDMTQSDNGLYRQNMTSESVELYEWPTLDAAHETVTPSDGLLILAVVGDDWYHVWSTETGQSGYLRAEDVQAGNG